MLRRVIVVGASLVVSALVNAIVMAPAHAADAPTTTAATDSTPSTTARVTPGKPTSNGGGPSVSLVVKEIAVGSTVSIRLSDFTAKVLTVTVCGNEGRRGSVDCNVPDAKTVEVPSDSKVFLADFIVTKPPAPCPCIIQAASDRFDEVAVAAFTLLGHPIAPVVDSGKGIIPLQVSIVAEPADDGLWARARTSLAGATWYDVTVILQNTSASVLQGAAIAVEVGRNTEDSIRDVAFPKIDDIGPRGTWRETVRLRLSSPVYGTYVWRATTTAFGLSTTATTTTKNQPTLFVVLAGIFGLAVLTLVVRLTFHLVRRLLRRRKRPAIVSPPLT
ncbi:MAG: hypothetical protein F2934_10290 [Actinobacteria bacterium]|nr:hypothetical protein [Actinomycetota bacterium]MSZ03553.1 hypothetical protein [Actinomycetota bacterium]MTB07503.1 hypothetical protein [Actinomycetota bacterium]